jgi:hypothetical protein
VHDNVLYHSLPGSANQQQVSRSLVRNGDFSDIWSHSIDAERIGDYALSEIHSRQEWLVEEAFSRYSSNGRPECGQFLQIQEEPPSASMTLAFYECVCREYCPASCGWEAAPTSLKQA